MELVCITIFSKDVITKVIISLFHLYHVLIKIMEPETAEAFSPPLKTLGNKVKDNLNNKFNTYIFHDKYHNLSHST